jgi:hypothetical protein
MATPCPVAGLCPKPCPTQLTCTRVGKPSGDDAYVWLGDLAGFEIVPEVENGLYPAPYLELRHRCGWSARLPFEGITGDAAAYLANTVERAINERRGHVCG